FCSHSSRLPPPSPPPPTRRSSDLLAPAALKDDRLRLQPRHEVDVRPREELRPEAEPLGRIVVAADRNDRHAELPGHPPEKIREQLHRLDRRHRSVVDVAGQDQRVRALVVADRDQLVEGVALIVEERDLAESLAQVPVGGVNDPHAPTLAPWSDIQYFRSSAKILFTPRNTRNGNSAPTRVRTSAPIAAAVTPLSMSDAAT